MRPASRPLAWLWAALGVLILLTPIGVLAPGTAWGEWSGRQLKATLGFVPAGLGKLGSLWTALMPGYAPAFIKDPMVGYLVAALVGSALVVGVTWGLGWLLSRGAKKDEPPAPAAGAS